MNKLPINLALSYLSTLIGFLLVLLLARLLGAEKFSLVALGLVIGGFIVPLFNLGSDRTFVRDAVSRKHMSLIDEMILSNLNQRIFMLNPSPSLFLVSAWFLPLQLKMLSSLIGFSLWAGLIGLYPASWFDYSHDVRRQNQLVLGERCASLFLICVFYFSTEKTAELL